MLDVVKEDAAEDDNEQNYTFAASSPLIVLMMYLARRVAGPVDKALVESKRLVVPNVTSLVEQLLRQLPREVTSMTKLWSSQAQLFSAVDEIGGSAFHAVMANL